MLDRLVMSADDLAARRGFIGGSDATIIASGDAAAINALAAVKRGERPSDDLSQVLPVMLGLYTEPFNLAWLERGLGTPIQRRGERVIHAAIPWMACTLDGWIERDGGVVVQAKHVNANWRPQRLVEKYTAQVQHEMFVTGASAAVLSVIFGNERHEALWVDFDPLYAGELVALEQDFWAAVQGGYDPVPVTLSAPTPKEDLIEIDMSASNGFAVAAAAFLTNRNAAAAFSVAEKELKEYCAENAKRVYGHGIEVIRDGRGRRIRIMEGGNNA